MSVDLGLLFVYFLLSCSCVVCFYCMRFSFSSTKAKDSLDRTSLKLSILCRAWRKTSTQSVSQGDSDGVGGEAY